jgi:hypothetical protein
MSFSSHSFLLFLFELVKCCFTGIALYEIGENISILCKGRVIWNKPLYD